MLCVWNCPAREEGLPARRPAPEIILHYHGNLGPNLLPLTTIEALALVPEMRLEAVGYATLGQEGYRAALEAEAKHRGVSGRVRIRPAMPREALLEETRKATLGLALMPMNSANANFHRMTGASNKPFDYLACGVPLLVSDLPDWRTLFVQPGYGLACDPRDPHSIAGKLRWVLEHQIAARLMGEAGRQRVLNAWNYERTFEPVLRAMEQPPEKQNVVISSLSNIRRALDSR